MAKQTGYAKVSGKIEGRSNYYSKNGGFLSRTINPGMSSRVKTDAAYVNTRLNNAEFGGAGSCAGAMVKAVSLRWRYILQSTSTGMLVQRIKAAMLKDDTHPWGKRQVPVADMPKIQEFYNRLSKNQMPEFVKTGLDNNAIYDANVQTILVSNAIVTTSDYEEYLMSKGADGISTKVFSLSVEAPTPIAGELKYDSCISQIQELAYFESSDDINGAGGHTLIDNSEATTSIVPQNSAENFAGLLVVLLPFKTIGSNTYVLQELCAAAWHPVKSGTIE